MGWIILIIIVLLALYVMGVFNKLVKARNNVKAQWAQVDVQLKRRADLIPNLVETVKGYAHHESSTLEEVIKARNNFNSASGMEEEIKASGELTKALGRLMAVAESYPALKANENFLKLQDDLKDTENKIAFARQFYNDTALGFNNLVEMFPTNIIASMFKFTAFAFFQTNEDEKEVPKVQF